MNTEPPAADTPAVEPSAPATPKVSLKDRLAKVNPLHTMATALRKGAALADKLPTPGETARAAAARIDAIDPKAYAKRLEELKALEAKVESKFAASSGK